MLSLSRILKCPSANQYLESSNLKNSRISKEKATILEDCVCRTLTDSDNALKNFQQMKLQSRISKAKLTFPQGWVAKILLTKKQKF